MLCYTDPVFKSLKNYPVNPIKDKTVNDSVFMKSTNSQWNSTRSTL